MTDKKVTVLSVKKINKTRDRYAVSIDNGDCITLSEETLLQYKVNEKTKLSNTVVEDIIDSDQQATIKRKIIILLSYRVRSTHELRELFLSKGFKKTNIVVAINELLKRKYLDNEKFSSIYCKYLIKEKKFGRNLVLNKMLSHKLPYALIESQMDNLYELYPSKYLIKQWLNKKKFKIVKPKNKNIKIINFLKRKGFSWDDIMSSLENF